MGTNYYIKDKECLACNRYEEIHLGKSSFGWKFSFHLHEDLYKDVPEMMEYLLGKKIFDEYGREISYKEFWEMVQNKQTGTRHDEHAIQIDGYDFFDHDFS